MELRGSPRLETPISPSYPQILKTHKDIWDRNKIGLILDVWWFSIPAPVELRVPPCLKTPIPPSNRRILRTHNEIWDQNEVGLILDV
jgi:hypothetical protein